MATAATVRLPDFRSKQTVSQPLLRSLKVWRALVWPPKILVSEIEVDEEVDLAMMTAKTMDEVRLLEPYGQGNPEPVFLAHGAEVVSTRVVGAKPLLGKPGHLKLVLRSGRGVAPLMQLALVWETGHSNHAPGFICSTLRRSMCGMETRVCSFVYVI